MEFVESTDCHEGVEETGSVGVIGSSGDAVGIQKGDIPGTSDETLVPRSEIPLEFPHFGVLNTTWSMQF
jgi:hypothetical protein